MFKSWLEALEKLTNINPNDHALTWKDGAIPSDHRNMNYYEADFNVGDVAYFVSFVKEDDGWEITFGIHPEKTPSHVSQKLWGRDTPPNFFARTNNFNAISVLQYVISAIKLFINSINPKQISYSSFDPKLKQLYNRIKLKIIQEFPYKEKYPEVFVRVY